LANFSGHPYSRHQRKPSQARLPKAYVCKSLHFLVARGFSILGTDGQDRAKSAIAQQFPGGALRKSDTQKRRLSIAEAAHLLGVSPRTVRRYIAEGRIRGIRVGPKMLRVDRDELDKLIQPAGASI